MKMKLTSDPKFYIHWNKPVGVLLDIFASVNTVVS
jgi:hypothetical protein